MKHKLLYTEKCKHLKPKKITKKDFFFCRFFILYFKKYDGIKEICKPSTLLDTLRISKHHLKHIALKIFLKEK